MKNILKNLLVVSLTVMSPLAAMAATFTLSSPDFTSGHPMPVAMGGDLPQVKSCHGQNISPSLSWQNPPAATRSFALIIQDAQGRNGLGITHLLAYGIPSSSQHFERTALANGQGFTGGKNSFGREVYNGPCPPANSDRHFYTFTLIATDLPPDSLPAGLDTAGLMAKLEGHALASAGMVGTFGGRE